MEHRCRVGVRRTVVWNRYKQAIRRSSMFKVLRVVSGGLLLASLGCGTEGSVDEPITEVQSKLAAASTDFGVAGTFTDTAVADPSGFSTPASFVNFRRPTPVANESKVSSILNTSGPVQDIPTTLAGLMRGAAQLHEQRDPATPVPVDQQNLGRDFMISVFFAQMIDNQAGRLDDAGALGGPANLATVPFTLGMNDPAAPGFNPKVFNIFDAWETYAVNDNHGD